MTKTQQKRLDKLSAIFKPIARKVNEAAVAYKSLVKQDTITRVLMGETVALMESTLASINHPDADREGAILDYLRSLGVSGFSYKTVTGWSKGAGAYALLAGVKGADGVEFRDELPITTLIDLARTPSDPEHKTGGLVAMAVRSWDKGNRTDDEHRDYLRDERRKATGWEPKPEPSDLERAVSIMKTAEYPAVVVLPTLDSDGVPMDEYRVTLAQLVDVATMGYAWRDKCGVQTQKAYRTAFEQALAAGSKVAAPVADGSGAPDAESAEALAAAEALAEHEATVARNEAHAAAELAGKQS